MKKAAVIGNPIAHSLSPLIFNYWFDVLGIDGGYEAIFMDEVEIDAFLERLRAGEFVGCNVTIPFKETILQKLDTLDKAARKISAVNVIVADERGKLEGRNTDWTGFLENLKEKQPAWKENVSTAVVLGVGGAARAVVFALLREGIKIVVAGRNPQKVLAFARSFKNETIHPVGWPEIEEELPEAQLVINTTPLGMKSFGEVMIDVSLSPQNTIAYDLVYVPANTAFLNNAKAAGLNTIGGLGMLVHQAALAFKVWFGEQPPIDAGLYAILQAGLQNRR